MDLFGNLPPSKQAEKLSDNITLSKFKQPSKNKPDEDNNRKSEVTSTESKTVQLGTSKPEIKWRALDVPQVQTKTLIKDEPQTQEPKKEAVKVAPEKSLEENPFVRRKDDFIPPVIPICDSLKTLYKKKEIKQNTLKEQFKKDLLNTALKHQATLLKIYLQKGLSALDARDVAEDILYEPVKWKPK